MPRHRNYQNHSDDQSAEAAGVPLQEDTDTPEFIHHMVTFRQLQPSEQLKQRVKEQMMKQYEKQPQRHSKNKGMLSLFQRPRAIGLVVALALILLMVASISIPPVRASMVAIYEYLGVSFANTEAFRDTITVEALPTIESTPVSLTLEEAQDQVSFHIGVPEKLPEGLELIHINANDERVFLDYQSSGTSEAQDAAMMFLRITTDMGSGPFLPASRREDVQVHQYAAEFVSGGWNDADEGDPETIMGDLAWDDRIDSTWLLWETEDVHYWLETHNIPLSREEVIEIAESIR